MQRFRRNISFQEFIQQTPFTALMLIVNVLVFVAYYVLKWTNVIDLYSEGVLYGPFVLVLGEYYRLISAAFLHVSLLHILSNGLIGLFILTAGLERTIGSMKTMIIYFVSMLFSSALVVYFNYSIPTLGASGAIFGALGALVYVAVYRHDLLSAGERQWLIQLLIINILFTLFFPNISIVGHAGGFMSGYLISYLLIKRPTFKVLH
jgi:rhomboid protease GluP